MLQKHYSQHFLKTSQKIKSIFELFKDVIITDVASSI